MSEYSRPFAKRSLGQNFLQDKGVCRRIVAALGIEPGDAVLEIGPGRGALTGELASSPAAMVMAIEKDRQLAFDLARANPRLFVVIGDALRWQFERLDGHPGIRVVGNLPYNIASPLMWEFFSRSRLFARAVFMVQHEVGLRLVAEPDSDHYGALSAWTQSFVAPRYLFKVPPGVFKPRPKVDSAVLSFSPLPASELPQSPAALAHLLHVLFQKRRKQLKNILREHWSEDLGRQLLEQGIDPTFRPERLTPRQFDWLSMRVSQE